MKGFLSGVLALESLLRIVIALCLLTFLPGSALLAQTASRISGVVNDASGQAIRGVRVELEQAPTGLRRTAQTDAEGRFSFANLPPNLYRIRASATGFRPLVQENVELSVSSSLNVDLTLEVGALQQEVTVSARPSMVNVSSAELSFLVGETAMRELPLNGRNYTDLALLQPGVAAFPHRDGGSVVAHGLAMSFNGQDPRSNTYLLDGTLQNDFTNGPAGSAAGTALGLEAVREFRVELNSYSAEFGRNSGGHINALTKSGTNDPHGSLFWYLRNDNLDARNFFDPQNQPEFRRNQYGGSIGGPVRKEKTFYFLTMEALRENLGRSISTVVPDENARRGILPDGPVTINPVVLPYLNEMPLPNGPNRGSGLATYLFGFDQTLRQTFGQGRLDHYFNDRHQIFGRFTADDADQSLPTDFPQFPRAFRSRNQFATVEHRWIQSTRTTHTFRGSFGRTRIGQDVENNNTTALPVFVPGRPYVGNLDIGGMPRWGTQTSVNVKLTQNVYGFDHSMAHVRGRHVLRAGGLFERYQDNMVNPTFSLGIHTFPSLRTFLTGRPARFLGLPAGGAVDRYWRFNLFGFYLQDDWKATRRLTLNMGVRYEFSSMPLEKYGRDASLPNLYDSAPTIGPLYRNPTHLNISPRLGFAYDLTGDGRTALRGGYGIYFNTNNQQHLIVTVTNPPFTPRVAITNPAFPAPDFSTGVGNSMRPIDFHIRSPRIELFNLMLERQLPADVLISAGFAGSRGHNLWRSTDWNIAEPVRQSDGTLFWPAGTPRRNPRFGVIELKTGDGRSSYNAAILEVRKRFSRGLMAQSSYTFSRNIDNTQASTFFSDATNGTTAAFPEFPGFQYNKGLADYHAKHNWVASFVWQMPFGASLAGPAKALLHGWQWSGIFSMRSGNPLTLFVSQNRSRSLWGPSLQSGMGFDRPSMAPGFTHQSAINGAPDRWFQPEAFALQRAGTLGDLGRGALIGPDLRSLDLALMKNFRLPILGESGNLQFRVESFNLANRANFGPPGLAAFAGATDNEKPLGSLGLIRNTVTSARQIQLGLRFSF
jgi:hypothetical protein